MIKRAVKEIHPNNAEGFLLFDVCLVEQSNVNDNLAWLPARLGLKSHAQPAMRFAALFKAARRNRVGEDKECFLGPEFSVESLDQKIIFVIQHFLETNTADVTVPRSITRIAERHVVGGHGLGDRAGCSADPKESACYLLAGANFSEGPILGCVEIDLEGLLVGADLHLWIHTISLTAIFGRRKHREAACRG